MMGASPEANAYFYVSPYRRAKQTYENIVAALEPSQLIGVREDPRITEQQFGNLQDKASMEQAKRDRADLVTIPITPPHAVIACTRIFLPVLNPCIQQS